MRPSSGLYQPAPDTATIDVNGSVVGASSGRPLLRLKGGDPYTFGRGGEEAQALAEAQAEAVQERAARKVGGG